jgi:peroxiredoxin
MATTILQAGDRLPSLSLPQLNGDTFSLESLRGKRSLLFFWGSW